MKIVLRTWNFLKWKYTWRRKCQLRKQKRGF
jgi:hypothetical protein